MLHVLLCQSVDMFNPKHLLAIAKLCFYIQQFLPSTSVLSVGKLSDFSADGCRKFVCGFMWLGGPQPPVLCLQTSWAGGRLCCVSVLAKPPSASSNPSLETSHILK